MQGKDDQDILDMISSRNLVSIRDYLDLKENKLLEKTLSIHSIDNAFCHLPLADAYQGIVGITPQELLHGIVIFCKIVQIKTISSMCTKEQ